MFSAFPLLTTDRLILREPDLMDADRLFFLRQNVRVMEFIPRKKPTDIQEIFEIVRKMRSDFDSTAGITWAITEINSIQLIGTVGFWKIDMEKKQAEIGFLLDPDYQGRGLMSEALEAVLKYGRYKMGLCKITGRVNPLNKASIKLLYKYQFIPVRILYANIDFNGKAYNEAEFSLLY